MSSILHHREQSSQLFPIFLGSTLEQEDVYAVLDLSNSFEALSGIDNESVAICITDIPDYMIPADIISFFRQALLDIQCFRIFRSYFYADKYVGLLFFSKIETANVFLQHFNQQILSTLFDGVCDLRPVQSICIQTRQSHIPILDFRSFQQTFNRFGKITGEFDGDSINEFFNTKISRDADDATDTSQTLSPAKKDMCSLCLESISIEFPNTVVLYCGHSFHLPCLAKVEGVFCPICRFVHAHSLRDVPSCEVCQQSQCKPPRELQPNLNPSLLWKPSPLANQSSVENDLLAVRDIWLCLLCGVTSCGEYQNDHRRNHFESTRHAYCMNIFSRQVYDFAGGGYVDRLILQQAASNDEPSPPSLLNFLDRDCSTYDSNRIRSIRSTGSVQSHPLKISEHFSPSNPSPESDRHPLTVSEQQHNSGDLGLSLSTVSSYKGNNRNLMRPNQPLPLNEIQEAERTAFKLEDLVKQYNEVLAWRMQETRNRYEAQMRTIWQDSTPINGADTTQPAVEYPLFKLPKSSSRKTFDSASVQWLRKLKFSLQQEKQKGQTQSATLRNKLRIAQRELDDATSLVDQLKANEPVWQEQVKRAEEQWRCNDALQNIQLDEWSRNVSSLMNQLEEVTKFESSVIQSRETLPGGDES